MKKVFAFVSLFALGLSSAIGLNLVNNAKEAKEVDATPVLVPKSATIDYKSDTITGNSNSSTYNDHRYVYDFNGTILVSVSLFITITLFLEVWLSI